MKKFYLLAILVVFGALTLIAASNWSSRLNTGAVASSPSGTGASPRDSASVTWRHYAVGTRLGTIGLTYASGGQILHGWSAEIHGGPFGSLFLQGPTIRHIPNHYTRRSVIILAACLGSAALLALILRNGDKRRSDAE